MAERMRIFGMFGKKRVAGEGNVGGDAEVQSAPRKESIMSPVYVETLNARQIRFYRAMGGSRSKNSWVCLEDLVDALYSGFGSNSKIIGDINAEIQRKYSSERAVVVEDGMPRTIADTAIAITEIKKIIHESPSTAVSIVDRIMHGAFDRSLSAMKKIA